MHAFAETADYVNQREVISGKEMFTGRVIREVLQPCSVCDVGKGTVQQEPGIIQLQAATAAGQAGQGRASVLL